MNRIELNLNQTVKVKLDKKALMKKQKELDEINEKFNLNTKIVIDDEGYYKDQLWCIMRDFGDMICGSYSPIIDCKIVVDFDIK